MERMYYWWTATDVRYGTSKPSVDGGKYPYLRMNNLTNNGELNLTDLKYIDVSDDEKEKCVVRKGFFLFCKMYFNFTHTFSDLCAVFIDNFFFLWYNKSKHIFYYLYANI